MREVIFIQLYDKDDKLILEGNIPLRRLQTSPYEPAVEQVGGSMFYKGVKVLVFRDRIFVHDGVLRFKEDALRFKEDLAPKIKITEIETIGED